MRTSSVASVRAKSQKVYIRFEVVMSLHNLLGSGPDSAALQNWLQTLIPGVADREIRPEVKAYKTIVYHNYPALGISLEYIQDSAGGLALDAIHVYNRHEKHKNDVTSFSSYPGMPIVLHAGGSSSPLEASPSTTAKDFVQALGEPSKKGGGTGLGSGSINIWCEWNSCGVMVEFGGPESRGHDAWDRGREAIWKELTLFKPFIST
jgi:hypothetical protein